MTRLFRGKYTFKEMLFIWVSKHESANWGHYFYVSNWRRDRHFTRSSEPREVLWLMFVPKVVPSFLSNFN